MKTFHVENAAEAMALLRKMGAEDAPDMLSELARLCGPAPEGSFQPGDRVIKVESEPHDTHKIGDKGVITACLHHPAVGVAYGVTWDDMPGVSVLTVGWKVGPA